MNYIWQGNKVQSNWGMVKSGLHSNGYTILDLNRTKPEQLNTVKIYHICMYVMDQVI